MRDKKSFAKRERKGLKKERKMPQSEEKTEF